MLDWDSTEKTENLESQEKKNETQVSETLNNEVQVQSAVQNIEPAPKVETNKVGSCCIDLVYPEPNKGYRLSLFKILIFIESLYF